MGGEVSGAIRKVLVDLPAAQDGWPPVEAESLWALAVEGGYRIDNIPFYAVGLNYGDVVALRDADSDLPKVDRILRYGGHTTFRYILDSNLDDEHHAMYDHLREMLRKLGCTFENASETLYAIDLGPEVDCIRVFQLLELGSKWHVWDFEGGPCR